MKRILAMLLAVVMMLGILTACQSSTTTPKDDTPSQSTTPSDDTASTDEPVEITHFYNFDWFDDNFTETEIGVELQKRTNVKLTLTKSPSSDNQKLNTMIVSNQLPDLITVDRGDAAVGQLIESGLVYPLSDLIAEYAPEMLENSEPENFEYYNWTDGKQYYFPSFIVTNYDLQQPDYETVQGGTSFSVFRSDVYEAIGSPEINTADDLFNALMAAKEQFPDLTPWYFGPYNKDVSLFKASEFSGWLFPATQFGVKVFENNDGVVTSGVRSENFQEYIKFMNKCYVNGLLAPESFADERDVANAKLAEGKIAMVSAQYTSLPEGTTIQDNPDASWIPMPYLENGEYFKDGSGWTATFVSKNCKNLEAVMKFVSYCASTEGRQLIAWGIEGTHWEWTDVDGQEVPRYIGEWDELRLSNWDEFTKKGGFTTPFAFQDNYIHNRATVKAESEKSDYVKLVESNLRPHIVSDISIGLINPDSTSDAGIIQSKLVELATSYYPKMILAESEEAAMSVYNEFIEKADAMGLETLEAAWTENSANFTN